jgi:hypothetical protein
MIVYVLNVYKKSVSKREKLKIKVKKTQKNPKKTF